MEVIDEKAFTALDSIDNVVKINKRVTLISIIALPVVVIAFICGIMGITARAGETMYVLQSEGVDAMRKTTVRENRGVEAEMHLRAFYSRMFDLDPSASAINRSTAQAMELGGDDIRRLVELYNETGFYNQLIQENISMRGEVDSVRVNTSSYPYRCEVWGKQTLRRYSNSTIRTFCFTCQLENTKERTIENPHAFFISKINVTENREIKKR